MRVTGASMEPTLKDGDVLRIEPVGAPAIGDLVTYADPAGTLVTHRVRGLDAARAAVSRRRPGAS